MTSLTHLYVNSEAVFYIDVEIQIIDDSLCTLMHLKVLCFCNTLLFDLPEQIGNLVNLEVLDLTASNLVQLPDSITRLTNLVELCAMANHFSELPPNFGNLRALKILELAHNNSVLTLPPSFVNLTQLCELSVPVRQRCVKPPGYQDFVATLLSTQCTYEEAGQHM